MMKEQIHRYIVRGELSVALELLRAATRGTSFESEIILLSSMYNRLKLSKKHGTISQSHADLETSRVGAMLVSMLHQLEKAEGLNPSLADSPSEEYGIPVPVSVFLSFVHKDQAYADQLTKHLLSLRRSGYVKQVYRPDQFLPGNSWVDEINKAVQESSIILPLLSPDYLSAGSQERGFLELQELSRPDKLIIPILLKQVDWQQVSFQNLRVLPENKTPILDWKFTDQAWLEIIGKLKRTIKRLPSLIEKP